MKKVVSEGAALVLKMARWFCPCCVGGTLSCVKPERVAQVPHAAVCSLPAQLFPQQYASVAAAKGSLKQQECNTLLMLEACYLQLLLQHTHMASLVLCCSVCAISMQAPGVLGDFQRHFCIWTAWFTDGPKHITNLLQHVISLLGMLLLHWSPSPNPAAIPKQVTFDLLSF